MEGPLGNAGNAAAQIHLRHPASRYALPTIRCLSTFSKHRTVHAALLDKHTKALVAHLQSQSIATFINCVPQWKCERSFHSETAVESPDQSPPGHFNHLETPLGSTRTVQSRLSIHRNYLFPTTNIFLLAEQAPYNAYSTLLSILVNAVSSPILTKHDVILV